MVDDTKSFSALLNGLAKRLYYRELEISDELLKNELYPETSSEDFDKLLRQSTNLLKSMVSADMDFNQLDAFLSSHTKKRDGGITESQAKVYIKFWRNHKAKIHDSMVQSSTWNNCLKNVSWRVDIQSQTRHINQLNTPTAIVELDLTTDSDQTEKLQFEMDETKLTSVLKDMQEIDNQVKRLVQQ